MKSSRTQNTTSGTKKGKKDSGAVITEEYYAAVRKFPLVAIKSNEQNRKALVILEELMHAGNRGELSSGEEVYLEALAILIEEFEMKTYPTPKSDPIDILKFLMEHSESRQIDLVPHIFETQSIVSDVLRRKKKLTVQHIKRLSERFKVDPELFM